MPLISPIRNNHRLMKQIGRSDHLLCKRTAIYRLYPPRLLKRPPPKNMFLLQVFREKFSRLIAAQCHQQDMHDSYVIPLLMFQEQSYLKSIMNIKTIREPSPKISFIFSPSIKRAKKPLKIGQMSPSAFTFWENIIWGCMRHFSLPCIWLLCRLKSIKIRFHH